MTKFKLIQRGYFKKDVKEGYLLDEGGIVGLGYMGSAEFEFGTIPKAYRRIMHNYLNYDIFGTNIFTPENEELMLFCRKDRATELKESIQAFIEHPYHLKEFSELEKIPKAKKEDTGFSRRRTDFWWCIDKSIKNPLNGNFIWCSLELLNVNRWCGKLKSFPHHLFLS